MISIVDRVAQVIVGLVLEMDVELLCCNGLVAFLPGPELARAQAVGTLFREQFSAGDSNAMSWDLYKLSCTCGWPCSR